MKQLTRMEKRHQLQQLTNHIYWLPPDEWYLLSTRNGICTGMTRSPNLRRRFGHT